MLFQGLFKKIFIRNFKGCYGSSPQQRKYGQCSKSGLESTKYCRDSEFEVWEIEFYRILVLNFFNGVNCRNKIASSCICSKTLSEKANKEKMIIHWELYVEKMYSASWGKNTWGTEQTCWGSWQSHHNSQQIYINLLIAVGNRRNFLWQGKLQFRTNDTELICVVYISIYINLFWIYFYSKLKVM